MDSLQFITDFFDKNKIEYSVLQDIDLPSYHLAKAQDISSVISFLRSSKDLRFTILTDLFATDFLGRKQKRFEIVYSLLSLKLNQRVIIKLSLDEGQKLASTSDIFQASCWYEREIYDMFGIEFEGAQDMRRILTDYGFEGHPLRKDFPLSGHVQVKYDERLEKVTYEPVDLEQEFRNFNFSSPWKGGADILPGDEKATK